ncbi:hypothetical protein BSLG_004186 [Batrachochytrium salamandrivorans]|nr:hypothetical protein BSLG_004186 [Batrachochytrium salamandrivorans]
MDPKRSLKRACRTAARQGRQACRPDRANREQCMAKVERSRQRITCQNPGTVTFTQASEDASLVVKANVTGVPAGKHGWHVHQSGNTFPNCGSAGPHWNPFGVNHGGPDAKVRHEGDFGNFLAAEDGSVATYTDARATYSAPTASLAEPWFYMAELMIWVSLTTHCPLLLEMLDLVLHVV